MAELEYCKYFLSGFFFYFLQGIYVPGVEDDGFFADGMGAVAQSKADM